MKQCPDENPRRVAEDTVDGWWISTVHLFADHGFGGPPRWFETMVFKSSPDEGEYGRDHHCERYETRAEADRGHQEIVRALTAGEKPEGWCE